MDLRSLAAERTLLLDGAMGTQMMARGVPGGTPPELWNAERPETVEAVHRDYFTAGSDLVHTNTFGGTRLKLEAHGLGDRAAELSEAAARLAVALRDREFPGRLVAGDMGPTGAMLPPLGDADPAALRDAFAEQAEALVRGGVDLLHIETVFDLAEARAAVEACVTVANGRPVCCSMTFKPAARGYRTMMGVSPAQAAEALLGAGAALVGCNCSITADAMGGLVADLHEAAALSVIAQPNAGQPRLEGGVTVYEETPEHFAAEVARFPSRGAGLVGGCCGTTPAHIRALAVALGRPAPASPAPGTSPSAPGAPPSL